MQQEPRYGMASSFHTGCLVPKASGRSQSPPHPIPSLLWGYCLSPFSLQQEQARTASAPRPQQTNVRVEKQVAIYPPFTDEDPGLETHSHRVFKQRKGEARAYLLPVPVQQMPSNQTSRGDRTRAPSGKHTGKSSQTLSPGYNKGSAHHLLYLGFRQSLLPKHLTKKGSQDWLSIWSHLDKQEKGIQTAG